MTVFLDIALCCLVEIDRRFGLNRRFKLRRPSASTTLTFQTETSINFNEITRHYIPEGCHLHNPCHENLKSHINVSGFLEVDMTLLNTDALVTRNTIR
jgi:hypothetical protein